MVLFRASFCAPGACTHVPTWLSGPYNQSIADFSEQTTMPIHQPAQEGGSAQVTEQRQLLAQASHWAAPLGSGCRLKVRGVIGLGWLLEYVGRGASRSASEQEEQQNSQEVQLQTFTYKLCNIKIEQGSCQILKCSHFA